MDRSAINTGAHGGAGGAGLITGGGGRLSAATAARLDRAVTAGLITFIWFTWVAVLLLAAGGLAGLIWRGLPWSLLAYFGAAGAAAIVMGCRYGRRLLTALRASEVSAVRHAHPAHLSALVVLLAALFGAPPGWSQHIGEVCHVAVRNGSGDLVRDIRGNEVLTVASVPCPTAIPQIVAATPAAPMPLLAAKPLFPYLSDVTLGVNGVRVTFDFDSACLRPEFEPTLGEIAAALHRHPVQGLTLTGHADAIGPEAYNQGLSERRARAVATYLQRAGVAPERLVVSGAGEKRPIAPNDSEAGRAQNRRVEIAAF